MIDIQKQIDYWCAGAGEDLQVAVELIDLGRTRHGLFFAHLALEKMLKAHVCRDTNKLAPYIHSLLRLEKRTKLNMMVEQRVFLARFDRYQLEGRYPNMLPAAPDMDTARQELRQAREMFTWLNQQL